MLCSNQGGISFFLQTFPSKNFSANRLSDHKLSVHLPHQFAVVFRVDIRSKVFYIGISAFVCIRVDDINQNII